MLDAWGTECRGERPRPSAEDLRAVTPPNAKESLFPFRAVPFSAPLGKATQFHEGVRCASAFNRVSSPSSYSSPCACHHLPPSASPQTTHDEPRNIFTTPRLPPSTSSLVLDFDDEELGRRIPNPSGSGVPPTSAATLPKHQTTHNSRP